MESCFRVKTFRFAGRYFKIILALAKDSNNFLPNSLCFFSLTLFFRLLPGERGFVHVLRASDPGVSAVMAGDSPEVTRLCPGVHVTWLTAGGLMVNRRNVVVNSWPMDSKSWTHGQWTHARCGLIVCGRKVVVDSGSADTWSSFKHGQ